MPYANEAPSVLGTDGAHYFIFSYSGTRYCMETIVGVIFPS